MNGYSAICVFLWCVVWCVILLWCVCGGGVSVCVRDIFGGFLVFIGCLCVLFFFCGVVCVWSVLCVVL